MFELSHGQDIVLRQHLAYYPEDVSFDKIMGMVEDESEDIILWFPFENWNRVLLIEHLTRISKKIDETIIKVKIYAMY